MQISKYTFMRWGNLSVGFITYHGYSMKNLCFPRIKQKQRETAMPYLQNGFFGSRHNLSPSIPL